jgi:hypothetical protein
MNPYEIRTPGQNPDGSPRDGPSPRKKPRQDIGWEILQPMRHLANLSSYSEATVGSSKQKVLATAQGHTRSVRTSTADYPQAFRGRGANSSAAGPSIDESSLTSNTSLYNPGYPALVAQDQRYPPNPPSDCPDTAQESATSPNPENASSSPPSSPAVTSPANSTASVRFFI